MRRLIAIPVLLVAAALARAAAPDIIFTSHFEADNWWQVEKANVRMRDTGALKIETVWLNFYYGGTWTAPSDMHVYVDDVVISRKPIGPLPASR